MTEEAAPLDPTNYSYEFMPGADVKAQIEGHLRQCESQHIQALAAAEINRQTAAIYRALLLQTDVKIDKALTRKKIDEAEQQAQLDQEKANALVRGIQALKSLFATELSFAATTNAPLVKVPGIN